MRSYTALAGFTVVELLLVIVVIGILATITTVAYNGVTQRADNAKRIAAARQVQTLFKTYYAFFAKNPATVDGNYTSGGVCMTVDHICTDYAGQDMSGVDNTTLMAELRKVGTPPQNTPGSAGNSFATYRGLYLDFNNYRTYNGQLAPYLMMYWLKGEKQKCELSNVVMSDPANPDIIPGPGNGWVGRNAFLTSTKGYTFSVEDYPEDAGLTECYISL
jgi:prepilin-type N-terminal cleavage/methylation domain-containing protein